MHGRSIAVKYAQARGRVSDMLHFAQALSAVIDQVEGLGAKSGNSKGQMADVVWLTAIK